MSNKNDLAKFLTKNLIFWIYPSLMFIAGMYFGASLDASPTFLILDPGWLNYIAFILLSFCVYLFTAVGSSIGIIIIYMIIHIPSLFRKVNNP